MQTRARALFAVAAFAAASIHPASADDGKAVGARIHSMANVLAKAQRLAVTVDCTYDVVQDSGERIEFGERREVALRRPDRARVDVTRRDGSRSGVVFDGARLAAFDLDKKVYAVASRAGTVDTAMAYLERDLRMRLPLRELFAGDLPETLKRAAADAHLVGMETVDGAPTDHFALRGDSADIQLWIAREGDPLPRRIVVTYRLAEGQPQFRADLRGWSLDPDLPDSRFAFVPAVGAEEIPFLPRGRTPRAGGELP